MNVSKYRISLDVHKAHSNVFLDVKRGDNHREIYITLTDGGFPYRISEECYAVFAAKKPDKKAIINDCVIEGNTIIYKLTGQTTAAEGVLDCEVRLYGRDGQLITSPSFTLVVNGRAVGDDDELDSSDEFQALDKLLAEAIGKSGFVVQSEPPEDKRMLWIDPDDDSADTVENVARRSNTVQDLLITILRNGVYSTDQSANITALQNALSSGGSEEPTAHDITDEPVVNTYSIAAVTGNVEIVASAAEVQTNAELVTNGLLAYFDLRTATYNNAGTGSTTTILPTQGDGQLFAWQSNCVEVQDDHGIHFSNTRKHEYSQAGNTSATDIGTAMTFIMLTYGHVMAQGFNFENVGAGWGFRPQYKNAAGNTAAAIQQSSRMYNADSKEDYNFCVYRVDGSTLTEIMDTSVATYHGDDIDGFASWITTAAVSAVNGANDGVYCTAAAIYNRALTDVEIEEVRAFMKTLEVA